MFAASFWSRFGALFSSVSAEKLQFRQKASSCGLCRPNVPFSRPELFAWAGLQAASVPGLISLSIVRILRDTYATISLATPFEAHVHHFFLIKSGMSIVSFLTKYGQFESLNVRRWIQTVQISSGYSQIDADSKKPGSVGLTLYSQMVSRT